MFKSFFVINGVKKRYLNLIRVGISYNVKTRSRWRQQKLWMRLVLGQIPRDPQRRGKSIQVGVMACKNGNRVRPGRIIVQRAFDNTVNETFAQAAPAKADQLLSAYKTLRNQCAYCSSLYTSSTVASGANSCDSKPNRE